MSNSQLKPEWRIQAITTPIFQPEFNTYAIVEPELWCQWKEKLYQTDFDPSFTQLFETTQFSGIKNGPVLIQLNNSEALFNVTINALENNPCGCVLYTPKSTNFDDLVQQLRHNLVVVRGEAKALLRYYEPRTLLPLLGAMNTNERSQLFNGISQIIWFNKQWLSANSPDPIKSKKLKSWSITNDHITTMQSILTTWNGAVSS
ncbi:DUF4123 domain-containing protein [Vibrio scophthalmi]|uniref:DUF4123 domain-containing protein n=1 Tax=Vibrio scophthalmi TaxID=45658 RepID=UPI00228409C1|nr:DUF4123 domain-containing protein [Vibrio scophthalmi]MCY9803158.1 DUF4123 domain-containing protein [Vibrio scophthalmi]